MSRFDYDDLIQKQKDELDKIKTAVEIYQSEDKYDFERKKFKTENFRFFSIAILTAIISLGSSYFIESFKRDSNNYQSVITNFDLLERYYQTEKDKTTKDKLACELGDFRNTIKDTKIENGKKKYDSICKMLAGLHEQKEKISNVDTNKPIIKNALTEIDKNAESIRNLQKKLLTAPTVEKNKLNEKIIEANKNIEAIVNNIQEVKDAARLTDNIEKSVRQEIKINTEQQQEASTKNINKSEVTWFKIGYFLQFENFRITLQYLDKKLGIQVGICTTNNGSDCEKTILTKAWVEFDKPLGFTENGKSYRINLEAIDHAGKNPFTLAAYITFESITNQ